MAWAQEDSLRGSDDIEIGAGHTLLQLIRLELEVYWVFFIEPGALAEDAHRRADDFLAGQRTVG